MVSRGSLIERQELQAMFDHFGIEPNSGRYKSGTFLSKQKVINSDAFGFTITMFDDPETAAAVGMDSRFKKHLSAFCSFKGFHFPHPDWISQQDDDVWYTSHQCFYFQRMFTCLPAKLNQKINTKMVYLFTTEEIKSCAVSQETLQSVVWDAFKNKTFTKGSSIISFFVSLLSAAISATFSSFVHCLVNAVSIASNLL